MLDTIAFPDPEAKEQVQEVKFFSPHAQTVMTGYFTSEVGIKELGYVGNIPNNWDGVPQDVLDAHGLSYDPEWLKKCVTSIPAWRRGPMGRGREFDYVAYYGLKNIFLAGYGILMTFSNSDWKLV